MPTRSVPGLNSRITVCGCDRRMRVVKPRRSPNRTLLVRVNGLIRVAASSKTMKGQLCDPCSC